MLPPSALTSKRSASGTCGTGCFLELNGSKITNNQWLNAGDRVALEIDGLGRMEHVVVVDEDTPFIGG